MLRWPLCFGAVRHMKLIGDDPHFQALRYRNEQRLAALKASHRLYEEKREPTSVEPTPFTNFDLASIQTAYNNAVAQQQYAGYVPGSALGQILGLGGRGASLFDY
jgi:hypothetical protein